MKRAKVTKPAMQFFQQIYSCIIFLLSYILIIVCFYYIVSKCEYYKA